MQKFELGRLEGEEEFSEEVSHSHCSKMETSPSTMAGSKKMLNWPPFSSHCQREPGNLCDPALGRWRTLSNIQWTHASQKVLSKLSSYHSQIAKPCGYPLLLIPLVALCICFLINAFLGKAMKKTKGRVTNKSEAPHCELRTDRWRTILDDDMVSDTPDTISAKDFAGSDPFEEDHSPACSEKMSSEYSKLESKYLKFLSDCGISQ
ncbi:uncharacterized protein LOC109830206 isoform X2 [Asparagus officinalis]|uniref:uncharacterized protein LOC109830206 isoform X2 n=1 Tax=Asparagus officinalis TaxID=4686 RepID=UPI00098E6F33|nr:uncharacterized protein LOC109830206 isoform X2 [Asparagus officinalis]